MSQGDEFELQGEATTNLEREQGTEGGQKRKHADDGMATAQGTLDLVAFWIFEHAQAARHLGKDAGLREDIVAKRIVESPQAMKALVGQELGVSDWLVMTQERINKFAEASGDHQWIHVDVERCKTDMPDGKTIAHGNLTFSVISTFGKDVLKIENVRNGINYGSNKVRYTSPVQVGARIRGRQNLLAADDMKDGGIRMTYQWTVEIEGKERPACVAETMSIAYAKT